MNWLIETLPSHAPAFGLGLIWFLLAGFCTSFYASLVVSQDAGLQRLIEKYPKAESRIRIWEDRWDLLRTSVFFSAMICAIGGVITAVRELETASSFFYAELAGVVAVIAIILTLLLNVVPRVLSEGYADLTSVRYLPVAILLSRILFPLTWPIARLESRLMRWAITEAGEEDSPTHEEEILHLVDSTSEEVLDEEEREMIKSVFEFGETVARENMTPRIDLVGVEDTLTVKECGDAIKNSPHSRFPVYHETIDQVRGSIHVKDILRLIREGEGDRPIGDFAKDITFIPETTPLNDLLQLLRTEKEQLAIVVDEYGGTAGLITMEDIIEELVGEIHDEYDTDGLIIQRLPNGTAVLDARMPVADANKLLDLDLPEADDYDSIGGFIYHDLGRIPRPGESLERGTLRLTVQAATPRRIQTVQITTQGSTPMTNDEIPKHEGMTKQE